MQSLADLARVALGTDPCLLKLVDTIRDLVAAAPAHTLEALDRHLRAADRRGFSKRQLEELVFFELCVGTFASIQLPSSPDLY